MHGHPFSIVEEEGFNLMQKWEMPGWRGISRIKARTYRVNVSEAEKKRLKLLLKNVKKISITTDYWKLKNQKIENMVIGLTKIGIYKNGFSTLSISHLLGAVLRLQMLWRCLEKWGIDSKVHTFSVDNASANDSAIDNMSFTLEVKRSCLVRANYSMLEVVVIFSTYSTRCSFQDYRHY